MPFGSCSLFHLHLPSHQRLLLQPSIWVVAFTLMPPERLVRYGSHAMPPEKFEVEKRSRRAGFKPRTPWSILLVADALSIRPRRPPQAAYFFFHFFHFFFSSILLIHSYLVLISFGLYIRSDSKSANKIGPTMSIKSHL